MGALVCHSVPGAARAELQPPLPLFVLIHKRTRDDGVAVEPREKGIESRAVGALHPRVQEPPVKRRVEGARDGPLADLPEPSRGPLQARLAPHHRIRDPVNGRGRGRDRDPGVHEGGKLRGHPAPLEAHRGDIANLIPARCEPRCFRVDHDDRKLGPAAGQVQGHDTPGTILSSRQYSRTESLAPSIQFRSAPCSVCFTSSQSGQ